MKRYIDCLVNNEYVRGANVPIGSAGSHNDVVLRLAFNSLWEGLTKKITWVDAYGESATLTILTQDMIVGGKYEVPIPYEAKKYAGTMSMSIKGVIVDDHTLTATVNRTTWEASTLGGTDGLFNFVYDGVWTYNGTSVTLSTYGITATGTPIKGDLLTVTRNGSSCTIEAEAYHPEIRATISATADFEVLDSTWDEEAEESQEPTSSQYDQIQQEINYFKNSAPYIGVNNHWYVWNNTTKQYDDTNVNAVGIQGETGVGISSITKTSTVGLVDTYTITFTNSTTTTYQVTNGAKGDTGDTGATGNGISSVSKTSTVGLVDTYTITFTNGSTTTFTVTNGRNGSGTGDMEKSDYDSDSTVKTAGGIKAYVQSYHDSSKQDTISDLSTIRSGAALGATALQSVPDLDASKITSGQFADERISSANTWNGKSAKATVYTGTLLANGWSNNEQTLTISGLAISGMAYTVSPTSGDFEDYASAMIWANDVTVANNITFNCKEVPSADIDIIILGCEVA